MTNLYLFKLSEHLPNGVKFLLSVTVMASINILGIIAGKLLPRSPDLYLDNLVLGVKL